MQRLFIVSAIVAGLFGAGWVLSAGRPLPAAAVAGLSGDPAAGEAVFHAAGCASCHMAPEAEGPARRVLSGGQRFPSPFGTFVAPNISPDPDQGIGGWDLRAFASALKRGVRPDGAHYFPAFPYTTYTRMTLQDVADLKAFMDLLPPDATPSQPHEVAFPFNIRRSLFGWKLLFLDADWVLDAGTNPSLQRGRYLVEAMGHCAECHTSRNILGGIDKARWMAGAPNPAGKGRIPNITPGALDWSEADIAYYLETGFTPDFDSVGGHMAFVVENTALLAPEDRAAIAAYLKALPPLK
ncbi:MAG: cytochrome c [Rhodobacteraceae bacterium]|nr:cytochrome c [Paracoccaceae bacterium]